MEVSKREILKLHSHHNFHVCMHLICLVALALVDPVNDKIDVLALSDTRLEFVVPPIDPPPTDMRWYLTPDYGTNPGVEILITPTTNPRYTLSSDMLSLSITSASLEDQGIYRLAVQNLVGVSNGYINLAVYGKIIIM